jgi:hypothetical protein
MNAKAMVWTGRILTLLFALFILFASVAPKLTGAQVAVDIFAELCWPARHLTLVGLLELGCLVLYLIPRTSVLGAVLFTGLLGGAMATQLRAESPLFSHVLFSLYLGLAMWGGLWLRSSALRRLMPLTGR